MTLTKSTALIMFALAAMAAPACSRGADPSTQGAEKPARDPRKVVSEGGTLLDVRTPEEFAEAHIQGARNIPVDDLVARKGELTKGTPVVVYCHSGSRSARAAKLLVADGFDVIDLGAMSKW